MSNKDYYDVMGLSQDASEKDIKMAYRRLARKYHPDLNKEAQAEEQFKALGEAYEVLKDPAKRKAYDAAKRQGGTGRSQDSDFHAYHESSTHGAGSGSFDEDLFESLFGQARYRHAPVRGMDRHGTLRISLEEAFHGAVKTLYLPNNDPAKPEPRQLNVNIPAGIRTNQPLRLTGQGDPGVGGNGDLYLTLEIEKHPLFDVMGDDIYVTLPVTPWEAALGCTIRVPTLDGPVALKIPEGSQAGQTLRLKKRGLKGATVGDQYVLLKIMIPTPKTEADKACYHAMAKEMPFDPRKAWGGSQ